MASNYLKKKPYTLLQQKVALKANYKDSDCVIENKKLVWCGKVKPTAFSKEYNVMVTYKMFESPKIWVIGEELEQLDNSDFPHNYRVEPENKMVRICLYRYAEFSKYKLLAKTIIPWTIEWLYFYELWLATGEWLGGGQHPSKEKVEDVNSEL